MKPKRKQGLLDFKMRGDYLKPFLSFYDPKAMDQPFTLQQVEKAERQIYKDVEICLKQVRSSKNLNSKVKKSKYVQEALRQQLDYLEDLDCERLNKEERESKKEKIQKVILKMVPENYKIQILPSFFNYTDAERIKTVIAD